MYASRTNWSLEPNRLSLALEARRRQGLPLLDLTESNPTRCGFAYDSSQILGALSDSRSLRYKPDPRGLLAARQAVARYYAERGVEVRPEQIFLTTSTSEAYMYVFRLLADPGDNLLAPQPSYPLFDFLAGLSDVEIVPYPLRYDQRWHMDLDALAAGLNPRTRAILVVHPNNPTGSFVQGPELVFLRNCCQEHRLAIIADEVFADYVLEPDAERVASFAGVTDALTFTLSGLSKISALPQMKVAWVVASGPAEDLQQGLARLEVIADTYLSLSAPAAHALPAWMESRRSVQAQIRDRLSSNLKWLDTQLVPSGRVSRLRVEGGWYVILKILSARGDDDWAVDLVAREGVLVHPGHFFDFPEDGYLVASLLTPPEVFERGLRKGLDCISKG